MSKIEDLEKEVAELKQLLTSIPGVKVARPVTVDLKYLCPKDPNFKAITEAEGVVMPAEGPTHLNGWITDIKNTLKKHRTFNQEGKEIEFTSTHTSATWKCQTCGAEKNVDPYP
jgi:hypothetical protein